LSDSEKDLEELSIDEWVATVSDVYKDVDSRRTGNELWLQVLDEASKMMESIRKEEIPDTTKQCVKVFGWLGSLVAEGLREPKTVADFDDPIIGSLRATSVNDFIGGPESLGKFILLKYPEVCHTCGGDPCDCTANRMITENRRSQRYENKFKELQKISIARLTAAEGRFKSPEFTKAELERPIDEVFHMYSRIYGGIHYDIDLWKIGDHLMEEIGEVGKRIVDLGQVRRMEVQAKKGALDVNKVVIAAYKKTIPRNKVSPLGSVEEIKEMGHKQLLNFFKDYHTYGMKSELADSVSWLSGVWNKIAIITKARDLSFAERLTQNFKNYQGLVACRACGNTRCNEECLSIDLCSRTFMEQATGGA